ncbi:MAG: hypothetical protein O9310_11820 [Leptospiraceae bacterium]|nr:hypothetical protein [Leptospiraceae bacterium]
MLFTFGIVGRWHIFQFSNTRKEFQPESRGFQIFEVGDGYTDMTKIDRSIIIENLSFEKMEISKQGSIQIKYDAICKASKYDKTFWKQNIDYTTSRGDLKDHELIQNAVQELFNKLSLNGDI